MMVDYDGKTICEGDYLIEADEESANFFEVKNGKPKYFATWNLNGKLKLVNLPAKIQALEEIPDDTPYAAFYKRYTSGVHAALANPKPEEMYIVTSPVVKDLLDGLLNSKDGEIIVDVHHICLL